MLGWGFSSVAKGRTAKGEDAISSPGNAAKFDPAVCFGLGLPDVIPFPTEQFVRSHSLGGHTPYNNN